MQDSPHREPARASVAARSRPGAGTFRLALLLAAFGLLSIAFLGRAGAQDATAPPPGITDAVIGDLAQREAIEDPLTIEVLRSAPVAWNDGCLGVAEPEESCTQAQVDGFVIWLSVEAEAYRYHTDDTGGAFRFAEGPIDVGDVATAPLPEGAEAREIAPPDDGVGSASEIAEALAGVGVSAEASGDVATQDWIVEPGEVLVANGANIEIFTLGSEADVESAIEAGSEMMPEGASIWSSGALIVVLPDAQQHADVEMAIIGLFGAPQVSAAGETPAPPADDDDGDVPPAEEPGTTDDDPAPTTPPPAPAPTGSGGVGSTGASMLTMASAAGLAALTVATGRRLTAGPQRMGRDR